MLKILPLPDTPTPRAWVLHECKLIAEALQRLRFIEFLEQHSEENYSEALNTMQLSFPEGFEEELKAEVSELDGDKATEGNRPQNKTCGRSFQLLETLSLELSSHSSNIFIKSF